MDISQNCIQKGLVSSPARAGPANAGAPSLPGTGTVDDQGNWQDDAWEGGSLREYIASEG